VLASLGSDNQRLQELGIISGKETLQRRSDEFLERHSKKGCEALV